MPAMTEHTVVKPTPVNIRHFKQLMIILRQKYYTVCSIWKLAPSIG